MTASSFLFLTIHNPVEFYYNGELAHYYGFILGNEILPNLVPGYYPDHVLTVQYRAILEHYLGSGA
jgi:hypothetical protein